jgi:aminoglycoside phosphotransferase (APT) family kinase protein
VIGENEALADYLVRQIPGFAESPELEAVTSGRDRSDVVAGALGRYLLRLERKAVRREADAFESGALERAFAVLEELAGSDDPEIREALISAIFEPLHADDVVVAAVETRLGPRSRALFRRWAV